MINQHYRRVMEIALAANERIGAPVFYRECQEALDVSSQIFSANEYSQKALAIIQQASLSAGHGVEHARKVALEAGAIIVAEISASASNTRAATGYKEEVALAHIAGLLHDICRGESEHARKGAERAQEILLDFSLSETSRRRIVKAINAHEAFQERAWDEIGDNSLLANALYDADKFRWGPDNFTITLLEMLRVMDYPLKKLLKRWERGMVGVEKIKDTFRSNTGRIYGPDFIERGLAIGAAIHQFLKDETET